ncbi:cell division protein ZipA C-terminal FtsZ-binding domain-containing protein [Kingella potus]|uniref:cell division protein ZipA C-terminal FtsZ-binding domain-containing protein n=1 Tax=Kingella potus TaxID=265175 RepID=UPI001FD1DD80|nr:cell division protein ZipA C-terminal FtsZ-binding domain-containing protein [Kingella potus]UOP01198.1 cell division protein ZipA [Kingella potus]
MDGKMWMAAAVGLLVILGVTAYNMYQENKYRRKVREQFGHSDKDALLEGQQDSVRDGRTGTGMAGWQNKEGVQGKPLVVVREADVSKLSEEDRAAARAADLFAGVQEGPSEKDAAQAAILPGKSGPACWRWKSLTAAVPLWKWKKTKSSCWKSRTPKPANLRLPPYLRPSANGKKPGRRERLLMDLDDMVKQELPWFEPRFDYMAYISLREPQEFRTLPRFSGRHRFFVAGCTMDGLWQEVEPVPNVYYQGFIVALQAISRKGLATVQELEDFGAQIDAFAAKLDAGIKLMDISAFLDTARPLDELCERVDQTIAMHLVSRSTVSGSELRAALERAGFALAHDGAFHLEEDGRVLFSVITMDNSAFTAALLASQPYKGFSILFDIPHVPAGSRNFDRFMDLTVRFSSELGLDLVNDKLEELSMEWLKDVGRYVAARQKEMQKVGIEPGGALAQRLFS